MSPERPCQSLTNTEVMLRVNHWTKFGGSNGGVREKTEEDEGVCDPIGRTTTSINQDPAPPPTKLAGTKPPTKEYTHEGTHGSSRICSGGWPCWASIGGKVIGPVKTQFRTVGECQCSEVGGNLHRSRGKGNEMGDSRGETRKGDNI
ncbi:rCG61799 [Rattus norvegicus]|uniref:RCG61799 n=1 Tax=Rattus norvegicus TaxID=10116 RepID=A6HCD8_RAT|nr:rCG61799 [Rattus norvegicus]